MPAEGQAGSAYIDLIGDKFPAGSLTTPDISVVLASTCNGSPVVAITPFFATKLLGSFGDVAFALPASLQSGNYYVSVQGTTSTGAGFNTSNCSYLYVSQRTGFIKSVHGQLQLGGQTFRFVGGNEAGLKNTSHADTDQLLQLAAANQFNVVRVWTFIDIGNADGSNSVAGPENGLYFQYWNGSQPAFNDSSTGLQNLDYAVYRAGQQGTKLILTLTNNWTPGGGMDQYVRWAGDTYHDQFYTDPRIRTWYEAWISHLLNHVNAYTGKAYKDDPTIMNWELANEPRCQGTGDYPTSNSCTTSTLTTWVNNESAFIKMIDHNHLVSVGDEGFFCTPGSNAPDSGCGSGDDAAAFAAVPSIDLVTMHLYTAATGADPNYGIDYINEHIALGKSLGKPIYLGEYGLQSGDARGVLYNNWITDVLVNGGSGALVWSLSSGEVGPIAAESEQGLNLSDGAPLLGAIRNAAQEAAVFNFLNFAPVADDQWATTTLNTPTALNPFQNLLSYGNATIQTGSLDLDPATPGQQTSVHPYGGTFTLSGTSVKFTPDNNFNGQAITPFTVRDSNNNISNIAYLYATVKPTASVAYEIESFETGADGWQGAGATATQSPNFATNGPHSLKVVPTQSGWFGIQFASPIDLANRPSVAIDMTATGSATTTDMAIQSGANYLWCQLATSPSLPLNTTVTMTDPLTAAGAGCGTGTPDFTDVEAIWVYLNAGNTYYLDNVRAGAVPLALQPILIQSFETGTVNWGPQNSGGGTVSQETNYYTDGQYGLQVNSTGGGGWFGTDSMGTLDLSSKTAFAYDIDTPNNGSSVNIEVDSGTPMTRCTGTNWGWADSSSSTQTIPFNTLSCTPDLAHVTGVWIFFSAGTYYIDNVRAQ
ncbi:MAG TPA: cellulase family glycosylhydrolase [Acidobacteriaceae bacterium]